MGRLGTLVISIMLARLLGPEEFGTYAVAFVALLAILSFNELGVSLAIVRWTDAPDAITPTVNTISVAMSAILTLLAVLVAPAFAGAMGDPGATNLVRLLSLCVLINGVVAAPAALMQRMFRQDQRMIVDQVNVWVGAGVSVAMALAGSGALSLVVGRLSGSLCSAVLFLAYSPLPFRFGFDRRYARQLLAFGLPLAGASIIVFLVGFVDQLVVGHVLGSVLLGYYVLAVNLANWPVSMFSQPLRSVAPALFSRLQHDPEEMNTVFTKVLRPLSALSLPTCAIIAAVAPDVVRFVYGPVWAPAGDVLRWLAVLAALRIFFELSYDFLVVLGRSKSILRLQLVWIVVLVPAVWVGVERGGISGAGLSLVAVAGLVSLPLYVAEFRTVGLGVRRILRAAWVPLLVSGIVAVACYLVSVVIGPPFPALVVAGLATIGSVAAMVWRYRHDLAVLRKDVLESEAVG